MQLLSKSVVREYICVSSSSDDLLHSTSRLKKMDWTLSITPNINNNNESICLPMFRDLFYFNRILKTIYYEYSIAYNIRDLYLAASNILIFYFMKI